MATPSWMKSFPCPKSNNFTLPNSSFDSLFLSHVSLQLVVKDILSSLYLAVIQMELLINFQDPLDNPTGGVAQLSHSKPPTQKGKWLQTSK